jgi:hypothetical protein
MTSAVALTPERLKYQVIYHRRVTYQTWWSPAIPELLTTFWIFGEEVEQGLRGSFLAA